MSELTPLSSSAPLRGLRAAFVFLTRIPVGGFPYREADWAWAPAHFPLVGLVVGAVGATVYWFSQPMGQLVAGGLAVLATVYLTGAFHEDGLADTADALGGAHSRKKIHDILKDSRIGTYGACAVGFSLLLRSALLAELGARSPLGAAYALVVVHGLARVGPVVLMAALPYVAGEGAKGSSVARGGSWSRAAVAIAWGVFALILAGYGGRSLTQQLVLVSSVCVVTALMGRMFFVRAGGYTGDFLGATEQVSEITLLAISVYFCGGAV